ncbi:MAG TPA: DUF192 domain-containing protein [Gemmatimonadaceae bacterium]
MSWMLATTALATLLACRDAKSAGADTGRAMAFDTAVVRIVSTAGDTTRWRVELAATPQQRTMGLMERQALPADAGMLFTYEEMQPADAGFWMYRTRIPLDIAYADSTGTVRVVLRMEACPTALASGCPTYPPNARYQYALEVNAGALAARGVTVGSRILVDDRRR